VTETAEHKNVTVSTYSLNTNVYYMPCGLSDSRLLTCALMYQEFSNLRHVTQQHPSELFDRAKSIFHKYFLMI